MRTLLWILALTALTASASAQFYGRRDMPAPGSSRVATDASGNIRIDQKLDAQVPMDARFVDESGRSVTFAEAVGGKPTILMPIFFQCTGVCTDEFANLTRMAAGFRKATIGEEFNVISLSVNPTETHEMAEAQKSIWHTAYVDSSEVERSGSAEGWRFLTGDMDQIRRVTDAVGFEFEYDVDADNVVHPAGIMVLTPDGRVSRYFSGTEWAGQVMLDALDDAAAGEIGVREERPFYLACINIDPLTGRRTLNVLNTLKVAGVLTVLGVATSVVVMSVGRRRAIRRSETS